MVRARARAKAKVRAKNEKKKSKSSSKKTAGQAVFGKFQKSSAPQKAPAAVTAPKKAGAKIISEATKTLTPPTQAKPEGTFQKTAIGLAGGLPPIGKDQQIDENLRNAIRITGEALPGTQALKNPLGALGDLGLSAIPGGKIAKGIGKLGTKAGVKLAASTVGTRSLGLKVVKPAGSSAKVARATAGQISKTNPMVAKAGQSGAILANGKVLAETSSMVNKVAAGCKILSY